MGDTVTPVQQDNNQQINPHDIFSAISYIEQQYSNECGGIETSAGLFTTKQKIEFFEVGVIAAVKSSLVLTLLTPVTMGVFAKQIPLFGSTDLTFFDKGFVFCLSSGFTLMTALFIAQGTHQWYGGYTRVMIRRLMDGLTTGVLVKAGLMFLLFHFIYAKCLTDNALVSIGLEAQKRGLPHDMAVKAIVWLMEYRGNFLWSAALIVSVSLISLAIPWIAYFYRGVRIRAAIDRGMFQGGKPFAAAFRKEEWPPWSAGVAFAKKLGVNWAQD